MPPVPILRDAAALPVIRRRSGGGTVFHDLGNANYSVICPPARFDRDKHAEMVVRALRRLGVSSAHVNARHDICIARHEPRSAPPPARGEGAPDGLPPFKVSGSAYKLTRLRSLHHGTCLLNSPNLPLAPRVLRSPAGVFACARGVESVRSPIANTEVDAGEWHDAVIGEFMDMYGSTDVQVLGEGPEGEDVSREEDVIKGKRELLSREWVYGQTPQFSFSTHPTEADPRNRPALPFEVRGALERSSSSERGALGF
jgi:lipoate-protein ligase A